MIAEVGLSEQSWAEMWQVVSRRWGLAIRVGWRCGGCDRGGGGLTWARLRRDVQDAALHMDYLGAMPRNRIMSVLAVGMQGRHPPGRDEEEERR